MPIAITAARSTCFMPSSDISARMPPSPSLSARITIATYLIDVVMTGVQTMSDRMPSAALGDASLPAHWIAGLNV